MPRNVSSTAKSGPNRCSSAARATKREPPPRRRRRPLRRDRGRRATSPLMAMKRSPGFSVRVSIETPAAPPASGALGAPNSVREFRQRAKAPRSCGPLDRRPRALCVGKRQRPVADDLAGFMTFAGDDQRIARLSACSTPARIASPRSPISLAPGAAARIAARMLAGFSRARVVVGDDDDVGEPRRDLAHDRPLAGIAIAAAAEDDDEPPASRRVLAQPASFPARRACGRSRRSPTRRELRRRAPAAPARLADSRARRRRAAAPRRPRWRAPPRRARWRPGNRRAAAASARKRVPRGKTSSRVANPSRLARDEADRVALGADRERHAARCARRLDHARRDLAVGVDRRTARRAAVRSRSEPQLGLEDRPPSSDDSRGDRATDW